MRFQCTQVEQSNDTSQLIERLRLPKNTILVALHSRRTLATLRFPRTELNMMNCAFTDELKDEASQVRRSIALKGHNTTLNEAKLIYSAAQTPS
jgi:hypothetical protein